MDPQNLSLDINTFVQTATVLALLFAVLNIWRGRADLRTARDLPYFRLRQERLLGGWRKLFFAVLLFAAAGWLAFYGEAAATRVFPVTNTPTISPTASLTATETVSPTITLTPSDTPTLQFSLTPSETPIPTLPPEIISLFESEVIPTGDSVFSPLVFSRGINFDTYLTIDPGTEFQNPVNGMYASFSYDQMVDGVQWTAVWYRDGELVHFETLVWSGGTGGFGFSEWIPDAEEWLPGVYQVQIFVGTDVRVVGEFTVVGDPLTSTPTSPPTSTPTPTATRTNTPTVTPTHTRFPTLTYTPTPVP